LLLVAVVAQLLAVAPVVAVLVECSQELLSKLRLVSHSH
jgi:hypothetical protein